MIADSHRIDRETLAARGAVSPSPPLPRREDESADPVGDGHSDAEFAAQLPPVPGRPNPEPDQPAPSPPDDGGLPDEPDDDQALVRRA